MWTGAASLSALVVRQRPCTSSASAGTGRVVAVRTTVRNHPFGWSAARVSTVADLHRLEPGVQASLALVEQAVEQHDRGFELVGNKPQPGTEQ